MNDKSYASSTSEHIWPIQAGHQTLYKGIAGLVRNWCLKCRDQRKIWVTKTMNKWWMIELQGRTRRRRWTKGWREFWRRKKQMASYLRIDAWLAGILVKIRHLGRFGIDGEDISSICQCEGPIGSLENHRSRLEALTARLMTSNGRHMWWNEFEWCSKGLDRTWGERRMTGADTNRPVATSPVSLR